MKGWLRASMQYEKELGLGAPRAKFGILRTTQKAGVVTEVSQKQAVTRHTIPGLFQAYSRRSKRSD